MKVPTIKVNFSPSINISLLLLKEMQTRPRNAEQSLLKVHIHADVQEHRTSILRVSIHFLFEGGRLECWHEGTRGSDKDRSPTVALRK